MYRSVRQTTFLWVLSKSWYKSNLDPKTMVGIPICRTEFLQNWYYYCYKFCTPPYLSEWSSGNADFALFRIISKFGSSRILHTFKVRSDCWQCFHYLRSLKHSSTLFLITSNHVSKLSSNDAGLDRSTVTTTTLECTLKGVSAISNMWPREAPPASFPESEISTFSERIHRTINSLQRTQLPCVQDIASSIGWKLFETTSIRIFHCCRRHNCFHWRERVRLRFISFLYTSFMYSIYICCFAWMLVTNKNESVIFISVVLVRSFFIQLI
jgi:hypothetical protein